MKKTKCWKGLIATVRGMTDPNRLMLEVIVLRSGGAPNPGDLVVIAPLPDPKRPKRRKR
jgi:hypothetical protein